MNLANRVHVVLMHFSTFLSFAYLISLGHVTTTTLTGDNPVEGMYLSLTRA